MERDQATKICPICPHQTDCAKVGSCLDEINAKYLASHPNQFPRLMTAQQAMTFTARLRGGETVRRLTNGGKNSKPVCSATKFKNHCAAYPSWGAEAGRLARVNAKATDALKGLGASRANETHCRRGHPYETHGFFRPYTGEKGPVGRLYRCCKACQSLNAKKGAELSTEVIDKVKALVRDCNSLTSFTQSGRPGWLYSFASLKRLRRADKQFDNIVVLSLQRRKVLQSSQLVTGPRTIIVKTSNLRATTLTGSIAGRADIVFSAINEAVSLRLPRHIRDEVMGQLFLDVEEGRVALSDIKRLARKYVSDLYEEERNRISLDAPAFRDGSGGSRLDRLSEADGMWA
jgi:hypothetical protein